MVADCLEVAFQLRLVAAMYSRQGGQETRSLSLALGDMGLAVGPSYGTEPLGSWDTLAGSSET